MHHAMHTERMTTAAKLRFPAADRARADWHAADVAAAHARLDQARAEAPGSRREQLAHWMLRCAQQRQLEHTYRIRLEPIPVPA
jgi:hypothetical protein